MKRSIRRHQQQVAKIRKLRILYGEAHGHSWRAFQRSLRCGFHWHTEKPWHGYDRMLMNDPGWWTREFHTRPARIRSKRIAREVVRGVDSDVFQWPDGKKPQVYCW